LSIQIVYSSREEYQRTDCPSVGADFALVFQSECGFKVDLIFRIIVNTSETFD
jgi:hypothetical protein